MSAQPTPLPWALHVDRVLILGAGPSWQAVVDCETSSSPMLTQPEREANAALIVRAVNAHADLLAAAKHAVMEWRLHGQLTDSCRVLEAAIAKVEQEAR